MNLHIRDCLVTGHEKFIPSLVLPDENDRHVLAVAIQGQATAILTFNLRDFPAPLLLPYGIIAVSPDVFLAELFVTQAENICLTFERQLKCLKNPPRTRSELLQTLAANGLTRTTALLSEYFKSLDAVE